MTFEVSVSDQPLVTPRVRGCQEIDGVAAVRASRRAPCPEEPQGPSRRGAPQHEEVFSMALRKFLILRKLRSSCLEGRTALIQPIVSFLTVALRITRKLKCMRRCS